MKQNKTKNKKKCEPKLPTNLISCSLVLKSYQVWKRFVHKVKVDSKVSPVSQKLRRLPFEAREKVSAKLIELEKQGVIEKIDSAEWVSPIVVAWKKSGDVRICSILGHTVKPIGHTAKSTA